MKNLGFDVPQFEICWKIYVGEIIKIHIRVIDFYIHTDRILRH